MDDVSIPRVGESEGGWTIDDFMKPLGPVIRSREAKPMEEADHQLSWVFLLPMILVPTSTGVGKPLRTCYSPTATHPTHVENYDFSTLLYG